MTIVDVNVLLNAHNSAFPDHEQARTWWEAAANGREPIGLAWITILGFVRIMTNPRAMPNPMPVDAALATVDSWFALPHLEIVEPGPRHREILFRLLRQARAAGNLTTDAHLAAMAIECQATLASTDADFARFPGLRWLDPLARNPPPERRRKP